MILNIAVLAASLTLQHAQAQQPPAGADDCMSAQSKVIVTGTTARTRLQAAQQSNDPAQMRAAVDEALLAVNALLAATEPCRVPQADHGGHSAAAATNPGAPVSPRPQTAAADPHAGHVTTSPAAAQQKPTAPSKPAAKPADPHAGHTMPAPRANAPRANAPRTAPSKPADPHAGHQPTAPATTATKLIVFADDPKKLVCAAAVDPDNAPTTTYKGKAYYFCTSAERLRFISNPETYLKEKGVGK